MRSYLLCCVIAVVCVAFASSSSAEDATTAQLVGTWKLVSAKYGGRQSALPTELTTLKHFAPTHFMWATYDNRGKVARGPGEARTRITATWRKSRRTGWGPTLTWSMQNVRSINARWKGKEYIRAAHCPTAEALKKYGSWSILNSC